MGTGLDHLCICCLQSGRWQHCGDWFTFCPTPATAQPEAKSIAKCEFLLMGSTTSMAGHIGSCPFIAWWHYGCLWSYFFSSVQHNQAAMILHSVLFLLAHVLSTTPRLSKIEKITKLSQGCCCHPTHSVQQQVYLWLVKGACFSVSGLPFVFVTTTIYTHGSPCPFEKVNKWQVQI